VSSRRDEDAEAPVEDNKVPLLLLSSMVLSSLTDAIVDASDFAVPERRSSMFDPARPICPLHDETTAGPLSAGSRNV
jgi:hypothetical protein